MKARRCSRPQRTFTGVTLLFALGVAAGCGSSPVTETVVEIDADDLVRGQTARVRVEISGGPAGAAASDLTLVRSVDQTVPELGGFPMRITLSPLRGDASRQLRVVVTALDAGGGTVVQQSATSGYIDNTSLVLRMLLEQSCRSLTCGAGQTCRGGLCATDVRPADMLPVLGSDAGVPDPSGCEGAKPPTRPTSADEPGSTRYTVVLRDILIDQRGDSGQDPANAPWRRIGYDLDGLCTTQDDLRAECTPNGTGLPVQIDGVSGIDNTFGNSFFPVLSLGAAGIDADLIATQQRGIGAVLLLIDDWNGELNDSRVTVTVTQTVLGTPGATGGGAPNVTVVGSEAFLASDGTTPASLPNWDGNDYFWGRADTFIANDVNTPSVRVTGYVTGGVLVARLPDRTPLKLVGTTLGFELTMTDLLATGNVYEMFFDPQPTPPTFTVAGRWGYNDMVAQGPNVGVCIGTPLYTTLQRVVNGMVDVFLDPPTPADPTLPCDALSAAIAFSGYVGRFGGLAEGQEIPSPCPAP